MNTIIAFFKFVVNDLADGASGLLRMTKQRGLHVNLRSDAGTEMGTVANPLPVTGTGGGFGGPVTQATVPWVVSGSVSVSGTVAVSNFPATQAVTQSTSPWVVSLTSTTITGTVGVTQSTSPWVISGSISFTAPQHVIVDSGAIAVTQTTSPWVVSLTSTTITGTVSVTQGTSPWVVSLTSTTITGTVAVTQSTSPWVVSLTSTTITGTVAVTQSGTWSVRTQDGSGTALTSTGSALDVNLKTSSITLPVSGTVSISGTVGVTQSTSPWVVSLTSTTITGTVAVTQSTSPWVVSLTSTTITGTVAVTQSTSPWVVSLASTTITGTVAVTQSTSPWVVGQGTAANLQTEIHTAAKGATAVLGITGTAAGADHNNLDVILRDTTGAAITNTSSALDINIKSGSIANTTFAATQGTSPWVVSLASTTITGTVAVTQSTSPWVVSLASTTITGTVAVTQSTSPWVVSLASTTITGTVAVTQSTSPWVVSLASTTITGTVAVTQSTDPWNVQGKLTQNNAAPAATTNLGVLPAVATALQQSYTEGTQVLESVDLKGSQRVRIQDAAGNDRGANVTLQKALQVTIVPSDMASDDVSQIRRLTESVLLELQRQNGLLTLALSARLTQNDMAAVDSIFSGRTN